MTDSTQRNKRITITLTDHERSVVDFLAEQRQLTISKYVRKLIAEDGHRLLMEQQAASRLSEQE